MKNPLPLNGKETMWYFDNDLAGSEKYIKLWYSRIITTTAAGFIIEWLLVWLHFEGAVLDSTCCFIVNTPFVFEGVL